MQKIIQQINIAYGGKHLLFTSKFGTCPNSGSWFNKLLTNPVHILCILQHVLYGRAGQQIPIVFDVVLGVILSHNGGRGNGTITYY